MVSVTQLYLLRCVVMITVEGVFKKKRRKKGSSKSRCAVCCGSVQERGGGERERERFKDRGDEMCDMR